MTPTESTKYPAIFIDGRGFPNGRYNSKTHYWNIPRLAELSKDLPIFDLPLAAVHIGEVVWSDVDNARALAEHVLRVQNADSTIPILMTPDGFVCDGWHRIVKGLIEGKTTIPARRFDVMPHPDGANT